MIQFNIKRFGKMAMWSLTNIRKVGCVVADQRQELLHEAGPDHVDGPDTSLCLRHDSFLPSSLDRSV